jgi:hypothetical protein
MARTFVNMCCAGAFLRRRVEDEGEGGRHVRRAQAGLDRGQAVAVLGRHLFRRRRGQEATTALQQVEESILLPAVDRKLTELHKDMPELQRQTIAALAEEMKRSREARPEDYQRDGNFSRPQPPTTSS